MKKRALFFLQSGVGGAERVSVTVGTYLMENGYDVVFCVVERPIGTVSIESFIPKNAEIRRIPNVSGLKLLFAVKKTISLEKPNIVFSSIIHVNTKVLAISWMFPKVRFIVRNNNYLYTLTKSQKFVLWCTYRFADAIIAQTDEMKSELVYLMHLRADRVFTIPNPIDTKTIHEKLKEKSPRCDLQKKRFVAAGRFFPVKGFDILVRAFKIVHDVINDAELVIVGNTTGNCAECFQNVVQLINELKLNDCVHCVGFKKNPYIYVKNADCFVLSSRNEGLPNVLIEALYLGTPVAATTCIPVISRIVEEGKTGYLAESENPSSLADAMVRAVSLGRISSGYEFNTLPRFLEIFNE